ncbi:tripartite motif-containing protein 16-like [Acanthochromis polyacanthus]|uniref:tripartite motif-containing protein 16-like n=1 Tax=Acanthochromis polyacanthus TaxID=80966 RepID=UPI00223482CA|nr:tripartite motif-containing protein 16-like [Acanthochromis polyacanthus]
MEQQGIQMDQEKLCCSICLDLLKDPVTINCGHSYCMDCIGSHWDGEDQKHFYSCPQCRQMFRPRPYLRKNTILADLVEEVKKTGRQSATADLCYAGPGDVSCDFCTGRKLKAFKSCLQCLVSYCDQHLQPHYHVAALKNHKLVDPSKKLQENICSGHNEVMKIFCRTDQQCICYLCLDEHRGHDTVSAAAEWNNKQRVVGLNQEKIHQRIQDREKDVRMLQQEVKAINQSADKAVANSEKTFKDLIRFIEKRNCDVKQQIRSKQTDEVRKVRNLEEKLKQELAELRRRSSELEQLSQTEDHIQFLHDYPFMSHLSESTNPANISSVHRLQYFDDVTVAVSKTRDKLQDILKEDWTKTLPRPEDISGLKIQSQRSENVPTLRSRFRKRKHDSRLQTWSLTEQDVSGSRTELRNGIDVNPPPTLPPAEPKTRAEFLKYSRHLTLDPNTANRWLLLSEGNRKATVDWTLKLPSDHHPDRFMEKWQVLSRESLTGRCYWEVEQRGATVSVAVTYKDISRTGPESKFGYNDRSWALENSYKCTFVHNSIKTLISHPRSFRIGVYLDHSAGILSFYKVSDTMTLIHRVQTTFTQPLYAGFRVTDSVELCELK